MEELNTRIEKKKIEKQAGIEQKIGLKTDWNREKIHIRLENRLE